MKKRILSIVLAVLMLVSVLPVPAMAATMGSPQTDTGAARQLSVSNATDDDSVHIVKSVNEAGTALTLEAYATNSISKHTSYEPLDIVLVLDVSGSMDDEIDTYTYKKVENKTKWSCKDIYNNGKYGYYIQKSDSSYQAVSYSSRLTLNGRRYWATAGGQAIGSEVKWDETSYSGELYTRQFEKREKKIVALKRAVNAFIDNVAAQKDSKGNAIANQISIVKFAGTKIDWNGSNEGNETDWYDENYSQVVKGLTDASTGKDALKTAVSGLTAAGATAADFGMQLATSVLDGRKDKTRKSVVIMFTDGEPNHQNGFDSQVASDAIAAAKTLKGGGTLVYTIGMFSGANPADTTNEATNKYMHAVSSNYPAASYVDEGKDEWWWHNADWKWHLGDRAENSNYYLAASSSSQLSAIFQAISNEVNSLAVKIDTTSVLSDTLSGAFTFDAPQNAEYSGITVAKYPVTGMENGTYTWGAAQELTIGEGKDVQVKVTGKTLEVKGFNYGANAVTTKTEGSTTTYSGSKLVVTIPIKPDTGYNGWKYGPHDYPTNDTDESKAGLSYGKNGSQKLELTESPEAPVTGYKVTYEFTGDAPTGVNEPVDRKGYITGQKVTAEPLNPGTVSGEDGTWTFNGWKPEGEQTFNDEDITFTGTWMFKEADKPDLSVTKTAKLLNEDGTTSDLPEKVAVGDKIQYTVKVKNTGNVTLTDIKVEDTFNGAGTLNGITYNATTQKYEYTINSLAVNAEETITYTYVVVADDAGKTIKNSAVATGGGTTGGDDTEIPVKNQYTVSYKFVSGTAGRELPDNIKNTAPRSHVENEGVTVTPSKIFNAVNVTGGTWTFVKWDEDSKTVSDGNVTFTGTWTFEAAEQPKYTLSYQFVSGTEGKKLPAMTNPDSVQLEEGAALTVPTVDPTTVDDQANNGSWTFTGWYLDEELNNPVQNTDTMPAAAKTIYGKWEFTKNEQPPEPPQTKYEIKLTISKELRVRSGSHPGAKKFWFDVSYYADDDVFRHAGEFSITLADGQTDKQEPVTVTVDKDAYDAILGGALVCVEERNLGENGFEYDTTPRFGGVVYIIITDSGIVGNLPNVSGEIAPLTVAPIDDSNFNFVNYYGKSGKVEKPVKVGPQLNRDDHVAYIMGYPDGTVQPEGEITRAEACTIFFRLLTDSSRDYYFSKTNDYTDVNAGDWFNNAISTLSNAGIVTGYNDGTFRPNQPITRGEMAKIIANFANLNKGTKSFTDLSGHWSKTYVELAAGNGWIAGYPDGSFRPDQKITRAETVTMINRVLERVPAKESRLLSRSIMLTFPDNKPGDWYYIAIQEASNSHEYQRSVYETTGDEMWTKLIDNVDWTKLEK